MKKKIRQLVVRLTVDDDKTLRSLARRAGCSESVLVRELIQREALRVIRVDEEGAKIAASNGTAPQ
jgi:predicted DNA-binding protein